MRVRIEVADLTAKQIDWLDQHLPVTAGFAPTTPRMCVVLAIPHGDRHTEMSPRAFVHLVAQLSLIGDDAPRPETLADQVTCQHGQRETSRQDSFVDGAPPIRTFADGCQAYGPYPGLRNETHWVANGSGHEVKTERADATCKCIEGEFYCGCSSW